MSVRVFIDAGHGGRDSGATGNGMRESDIVLEVCGGLRERLLAAGAQVMMSREADEFISIDDRWRAARSFGADYLVSVHANAGGGTGAETFIAANRPGDAEFARAVNNPYAAAMGLRNRGVKLDTATFVGSLGLLRNSICPAILVELAFIDSPAQNPDVDILRNRRGDMADALAAAIIEFCGISRPSSIANVPGRFQNIGEMPDWARPTVQKLINRGLLRGDGEGLNLSEDMVRIFVIHDRAGVFDKTA